MPGKTLTVGHNDAGEVVVNFEPDVPAHAWHAIFSVDEADSFANVMLKRARLLRDGKADGDPEAYRVILVTSSQLMALKDLLLDYVLAKRIEVFVDVVRQVETTPAELLALVAQGELER